MPFPLTTARVCIDALVPEDVSAFVAYRQDPEVARYQSWDTSYSETEALPYIESLAGRTLPDPGDWIQLAIRDPQSGELLGDLGLQQLHDRPGSYEFGCTLSPTAQGRGIASEAVGQLLRFLFLEHGAHRITASTDSRNTASVNVLERMGMRCVGERIHSELSEGEFVSVDEYAILDHEYRAKQNP